MTWLCLLVAGLAAVACAASLLQPDHGEPIAFTTIRGETVLLHGAGLHRFDTRFFAAGFRAQDTVTLVLGVPLLVLSALLARRGHDRVGALLAGLLGYFLYAYASLTLGEAYNSMFLVHTSVFSASLFALVLVLTPESSPSVRPDHGGQGDLRSSTPRCTTGRRPTWTVTRRW